MEFLKKIKNLRLYNYAKLVIYLAVGVIVISRGAIYYPDSYTFLDMAFNHSPIYCLFLKAFVWIFNSNFEIPLVITQYIIIILGIDFLLRYLKSLFKIHFIGALILQLIMIAPCIYLHFLGSAILSEAITYPIFLVFFRYALKMFVTTDLKCAYRLSFILIILILTRGQFLAFVPVLLLIALYVVFKDKKGLKSIPVLIVIVVLPLITSLSERVYNKIVFGYFVNNTMNYVHLITSPFFVSNEADADLFKDPEEQQYFKTIYSSLKNSKLLRNQLDDKLLKHDYQFYHQNFSNICNKRIYKLGLGFYENEKLSFEEQNIKLNNLCSKMLFPLIKNNFQDWFKLFLKNLVNSFVSAKQMLLFLILLFYGIIFLYKNKDSLSKFIVLGILLMFANNVLIAIPMHSVKRYVFYFDWLIFAIVILFINEILNLKLSNEN
ncbi:hypothetical protein L3X39_07225 [Sabulilitoribacter multivorans]|uniref:Dolichyl-phosphate-mannose-protein mannosyltransferase n=1 Tax=Flaviramulus multivorans TaxID=1304750 RepID=A0ABS9II54_9FLAO|nr:hypothetical protein [Flaviramulus multivorans]MCF7560424.1 hypothetical protein [Flaviramulus multivorans]